MSTREERDQRRPPPDEAPLEEQAADDAPMPQPERHEPRLVDPGLGDLSFRDWRAILVRAVKEFLDDNGTMLASALAYSTFFAIPSVLLVVVGVFTLLAGPETITTLMGHFSHVMPGQAAQPARRQPPPPQPEPLDGSRDDDRRLRARGLVDDRRHDVVHDGDQPRVRAQGRTVVHPQAHRRGRARRRDRLRLPARRPSCSSSARRSSSSSRPTPGRLSGAVGWIWWIAEWPILVAGLLAAFATLLYLGPDVAHPRWRFITPARSSRPSSGSRASGAFAVYTVGFGSYNKTWGSLAAVIIMLTWLWLAAIALLLGAEINAEAERSRELREGRPAESRLLAPTRSGSG